MPSRAKPPSFLVQGLVPSEEGQVSSGWPRWTARGQDVGKRRPLGRTTLLFARNLRERRASIAPSYECSCSYLASRAVSVRARVKNQRGIGRKAKASLRRRRERSWRQDVQRLRTATAASCAASAFEASSSARAIRKKRLPRLSRQAPTQ